MPLTIRPMSEADEGAITELRAAGYRFIAGPDGFTDEQLEHLLRDRCGLEYTAWARQQWPYYVAKDNGEILGTIAVGDNIIQELWVSPAHHRKGIATALFRMAEELIKQAGHTTMTVSTSGYGRPFYEAMGMKLARYYVVLHGPLEGRRHMVLEKEL
ncbi:MAG: GNAT family N-acetyltransferase [Armatimonadota bacterium]